MKWASRHTTTDAIGQMVVPGDRVMCYALSAEGYHADPDLSTQYLESKWLVTVREISPGGHVYCDFPFGAGMPEGAAPLRSMWCRWDVVKVGEFMGWDDVGSR